MDKTESELDRIREILKSRQKGLTIAEIAKLLTLNRISTSKYLNMLVASGQAEMRIHGPSKVFYPCQRVPISTILNFSTSLLLVMDSNLTIIDANNAVLNFFLVEKEELIGHRIDYSPIAGYIDAAILTRIQDALESHDSSIETKWKKDGKDWYLKLKFIPTVFETGDHGVTLIAEDITELSRHRQHLEELVEERSEDLILTNNQLRKEIENHKEARNALKTSETKYRELVENANSIILRTDMEGNIQFFNEFAQKFYGYSDGEVLGKNIYETIVPATDASGNKLRENREKMRLHPETYGQYEGDNIKKNGERVWIFWTHKFICNKQGQTTGILSIGTDLTERKHDEDRLKFQNILLTTQQEVTLDGILVVDENSTILSYNQRFVELWEIPPEILDRKADNLALEYVQAKVTDPHTFIDTVSCIYDHQQKIIRDEITLIDGRSFDRYSAPMIGAEGKYYGRIWYFRDITVQKIAGEKLRHSEEKLSHIIDFLPDATLVIDTEGKVIAWNHAIEELTGIKAEDILGKGEFEYTVAIHGKREPMLIDFAIKPEQEIPAKYSSCKREGEKFVGETFVPHLKTAGFYCWGTAAPLYDSFGNLIGAIESIRDITDFKNSENALKESEDRFRRAMDASHDGIWDWDITTGKGYFGPNYYQMLGYEPGEFFPIAQIWADFIHPDDRERTLAINQDCIDNRCQSFETEYRMKTKDGSWKWILGRGKASSRDAQGHALRMIGTHVDITERKRAEEALRESEVKFREIFNSANDGIHLHEVRDDGLPGIFIDINEVARRMLGYSKEEILKKSPLDFVTDYHSCSLKEIGDAMRTTGHALFETEQRRKDGTVVPVEINSRIIIIEGKRMALSVIRDITERKRAKNTLAHKPPAHPSR